MADQIQQTVEDGERVTEFATDGYLVTVRQSLDPSRNIKPRSDYPRVFVWDATVEETVMEQLINRRNRPEDLYRAVAEAAFAALGYDEPGLKWSQKAGCTCPCSPGFIAKGWIGLPADVSITFKKVNRIRGLGAVLATVAA